MKTMRTILSFEQKTPIRYELDCILYRETSLSYRMMNQLVLSLKARLILEIAKSVHAGITKFTYALRGKSVILEGSMYAGNEIVVKVLNGLRCKLRMPYQKL